MNFFGMGPMELIVILIIALIVFGPGKMPEMGKSLGKAIREFRRASQELTSELTREVDLGKLKNEVRSIQTEITQSLPREAREVIVQADEVADGLGPPQKPVAGSTVSTPTEAAPPKQVVAVQKRVARMSLAKRRDKQS